MAFFFYYKYQLEEINKLEAEDSEKSSERGKKRKQSAVEAETDEN